MIIKNVELELLAKDAIFFISLAERLNDDANAGSLIFSFIPYLSLFTWESANYLANNFQNKHQNLNKKFEEQIKSSRHRIKLFENPDELIQLVSWARIYHRELFVESHFGILAPLKRAIQPDLGIYTYNKEYYGSTLLALVNLGFNIDSFPSVTGFKDHETNRLFHDYGYFIGEYTAKLITILGVHQYKYNLKLDTPHPALFNHIDIKAVSFFEKSFNGNKEADLNSVLFILYLSISFLVNVFDEFIVDNSEPYLKIKYITLYHIVDSCKKAQNIYRPKGSLSQLSLDCFSEILSDQDNKSLTKTKGFRNTLVHYGIDSALQGKLDAQLQYYGLIEYYFPQMNFQEFNNLVDKKLKEMCGIMKRWLLGSTKSG